MAPFCIFIPISISADRLISMPTLQMKGFEAKSARAAEGGAGLCWGGGGGVEGGGRVAAFVGGGVGAGAEEDAEGGEAGYYYCILGVRWDEMEMGGERGGDRRGSG